MNNVKETENMSLQIQIPRVRIPYFAKWARLNTPFTKEKQRMFSF